MTNDDNDRSTAEIQDGIERTRSRLDQTLSAIEQRLTPGRLFDEGVDYLRHSGAREYVRNLGTSVKQDPLPLALVGIGLGWLMLSNGRDSRDGLARRPGPSSDALAGTAHDVADGVRGAARSVRDTLSDGASSVRDRASSLRDTAARTSEKISHTARAARDGADRVRSSVDQFVHEQPVALGAIGLAVGAVLAAAAPRTRAEDRVMGEASDRIKEGAKEVGEQRLRTAISAVGTGGDRSVDAKPVAKAPTDTAPRGVSTPSMPAPR
jgi:ElaB/YqjD/DUF883 family membrane-anchored ribosome-binding protein